MSITITPVVKRQKTNPVSNKNIETLLLRAKKKDEDAENRLCEYFKGYIRKTAAITCSQSLKWLSFEELESEGLYGLTKAISRFDPKRHHSPELYVKACIRNTMRDYVKGESPVHTPFSSLLTNKDHDRLTLEKLISDPEGEDLNSSEPYIDIKDDVEDLRVLLKTNQAQEILNTEAKKTIIELTFGTNLGTNEFSETAPSDEIARKLNMKLDNFYMTKARLLQRLKTLAQTMSA